MPVRGRTGQVAGRAHWRAGNYQGVPSLAREVRGRTGQAALLPSARAGGCTPGTPVRGRTGRVAGRALRAPGQLSGRTLACAGGAVCCGKEAGKVSAKPMARTCSSVPHKRERQLAAPWREETAEALRRCVAARAKSRGARTGARAVIGPSARLRGVRGRTGHAAFLRPAKAERSQQSHRRGRALSYRRARAKRAARGAK